MEALIAILVLVVVLGPAILAISALVSSQRVKKKLDETMRLLKDVRRLSQEQKARLDILERNGAFVPPKETDSSMSGAEMAPKAPETPSESEAPSIPPLETKLSADKMDAIVPPPPPQKAPATPIQEEIAPASVITPPPNPFIEPSEPEMGSINHPEDILEPQWVLQLKQVLFGGNPVAKVAIVILLFGVGFAIKLVASKGLFPLEFRLALVAIVGLALVVLGWRFREANQIYSRILMGGGLATLYLTFYGASRIWKLIPLEAGFGLMLASVVAGTIIAHVVKTQSFSILAFSGGFLAPFLAADGLANSIQLFSLYGLFNLGIFFLVWKHHWNWLARFGFVFTFVVAGVWGQQKYHPEAFAQTEPFLIFHWVLYLGMGFLLSMKKKTVISSLTLGPSLAVFGLQSLMLKTNGYGLAFSALCGGLVHFGLGKWAQDKRHDAFSLLGSFHGIIALGFVTLSLPLALSEQWTSAAWSVEAAAVFWIGLKSNRILLKYIGGGLLLASGLALLLDMPDHLIPRVVGCGLVFGASVALAFLADSSDNRDNQVLHWVSVAWGIFWFGEFFYALTNSMFKFDYEAVAIGWAVGILVLQTICLRWKNWGFLKHWGWPLLPMLLILLTNPIEHEWGSPLLFLISFGFWVLTSWEKPEWLRTFFDWSLLASAAWYLGNAMVDHLPLSHETGLSWFLVLRPLLFVLAMLPLLFYQTPRPWSSLRTQAEWTFATVLVPLSLWLFVLCWIDPGKVGPLPFIPIVNPTELLTLGFMLMFLKWAQNQDTKFMKPAWFGIGFLGVGLSTGFVSRVVHHFWGVPWRIEALFQAPPWQAILAIEWVIIGALGLILGARKASRTIWIFGAVVCGVVVAKLFLIDLRLVGAGARVIAFLVVGGLLLFVGHQAPLPPAKED